MWCNLPSDLLSIIFSYLSPDSIARAKVTCRTWHSAASASSTFFHRRQQHHHHHHPPWFLAFPTRTLNSSCCCYAHNPLSQTWHRLPLPSFPIKPIAAVHGLILTKSSTSSSSAISLHLTLTNPFTNQSRSLPNLIVPRTNPAVGLLHYSNNQHFKIFVAGGAAASGALYNPTVESYDSADDTWTLIGPMPVEFAVRLTVWTPNESVYSNGTLYWMTSARAYSVMAFTIATNTWHELSVPMADRLEFAALVPRQGGRVGVVGGINNHNPAGGSGRGRGRSRCIIYIWELDEKTAGNWRGVGVMPIELGEKLLGKEEKEMNWGRIKCVGVERAMCVYRELGLAGFVIYREEVSSSSGKWEWGWIEGSPDSGMRSEINNVPAKGLLLDPNLFFFSNLHI